MSTDVPPTGYDRLAQIADLIKSGTRPDPVTVRAFLSWFGVQRRGFYKVRMLRSALRTSGLSTLPDFEGAYIDAPISFVAARNATRDELTNSPPPAAPEPVTPSPTVATTVTGGTVADPTNRIGKLPAANRAPLSVQSETLLQEAVTLMLSHDYSQLPVMQSQYNLKGAISWTSIGSKLALEQNGTAVKDFMQPAHEVSSEASLFSVIDLIVKHEFVLVRDEKDNKISGIVTNTDLSVQFGKLGEPFLLLGEIENHIRRMIDGRYTETEVKSVVDPEDDGRTVETVADLTFGEYVRLLEGPERWEKLGLAVDRKVFTEQLNRVREIRNDIMHFDPDPLGEDDLCTLRLFANFLQTLQQLGAT